MSAELPGDQLGEKEARSEVERLQDAFYEIDEQISTGERRGVETVNEYLRVQRDLNRELARTRPADYLKYTRRAEQFERLLGEPSYEGKAALCSDEAEDHKAVVRKITREKFDPTQPEDVPGKSTRDDRIKYHRTAAANWLRAEADCLEDDTPLETIPPQEPV